MKRNNCVIGTILLLGLAFAPMNGAFATDNNLVQLDLKKGNGNAVDITFFTSENYGSNVIVRKKSDNKYVILMPKVLTAGYRSADLESVKDFVSNIDVKSVNDGAAGYTKVTLITTKPLNITTRVSKAAPLTEAQKQYKTLIAEAYTVKNNVNKSAQTKTARLTEVTTNKAPASSASINKNQQVQASKTQAQSKPALQKLTPVDIDKLGEKKENKSNNKIEEKIQKVTQDIDINKHVPEVPAAPTVQPEQLSVAESDIDKQSIQDIQEFKKQKENKNNLSHSSMIASLKNKIKVLKGKVNSKMSSGMPMAFMLIIIPIIALIAFIKLIHASLKNSQALKRSFLERISKKPRQKDYEHIINNENLNWQEKYQLYLNQSGKENSTMKSKYKFITQTQTVSDNIEEQRRKLEQLVTPEKQEPVSNAPVKSEDVVVHKEDQAITESIKQESKIKAFEPNLSQARRNVKLKKSRFTRFATKEDYATTPIESNLQPTVELKKTPLTHPTRQIQDANLKVGDVVKKDDYIMSSLDEFFATPETSVASTLAQIKPSMQLHKTVAKEEIKNPIEVKKVANENVNSFNGLIVKTGCNINEDRGFYIVNLDGTSALIGRIKDEVFVLKKFDDNSDKKLQVRHDKDEIYMVKTEGFKSLIDASNMGVLIEL